MNKLKLQNKNSNTMKKIVLFTMLMLGVVSTASAQSWKDLLGKVANEVADNAASTNSGNAVTNILGTILGNSLTLSNEAIEGTWSYEGVACVLESEDALSNIGGAVVTETIEAKLNEKLATVGISQGNCSFTFVNDGTCIINVKGYDLKGKYELDAAEKVIVFTFVYDTLPLKTYVAYEVKNLNVVFKADRLLAFIKNVASYFSNSASGEQLGQLQSITQAVAAAGTLLQNYDGMMLGAKLTRLSSGAETTTVNNNAAAATTGDAKTTNTTNNTAGKLIQGLGGLLKK